MVQDLLRLLPWGERAEGEEEEFGSGESKLAETKGKGGGEKSERTGGGEWKSVGLGGGMKPLHMDCNLRLDFKDHQLLL